MNQIARYSYEYPRPALAVDCVVFGLDAADLKVLLIQRKLEPKHEWALPGGFVHIDETLDTAARRELEEEAGIKDAFLEQLYTFGELDRDPRERVVTVAYYALVKLGDHKIRAATDAEGVAWFALDHLPQLAFDHRRIIDSAHERLRGKVRYAPIGFELLPPRFATRRSASSCCRRASRSPSCSACTSWCSAPSSTSATSARSSSRWTC
jgi:8-oxo-dGTP diphosphatase